MAEVPFQATLNPESPKIYFPSSSFAHVSLACESIMNYSLTSGMPLTSYRYISQTTQGFSFASILFSWLRIYKNTTAHMKNAFYSLCWLNLPGTKSSRNLLAFIIALGKNVIIH